VRRRDELIVGFTVVIALVAILAGALWLSGTSMNRDPNFRTARFKTVGGLNAGNPVVLRGVRVGKVVSILLVDNDWVEAQFEINGEYQFPEDAAVIAASASLFGEWQAEIISRLRPPNDPNVVMDLQAAFEAGDDVWPGATLPDIGQLTAQAGRIASDIANVSSRVETAFDSSAVVHMQGAIENFGEVTDQINNFALEQTQAMDGLGESVMNGVSIMTDAAEMLHGTMGRLDSATSQGEIDSIVQNAQVLSAEIREAAVTLSELITVIHNNQASIQRVLQGADSVVSRMAAGSGTVGRLVSDSLMYVEAVRTIVEMRTLVEDIKANPRKYFKFSVF
jgi:phospholipid/cholesterol/gamma-HCH transport system substrate-binding protein